MQRRVSAESLWGVWIFICKVGRGLLGVLDDGEFSITLSRSELPFEYVHRNSSDASV
jgi:hypothetical protein